MTMTTGKLLRTLGTIGSAIVMLVGPTPSLASHADYGYIREVYGTYNGAVLFSTDGARTALASCQHTDLPNRWAIEGNTLNGQSMLSVLLAAWAQHKRIAIEGSGACSLWGDTESVSYFAVQD